MLKLHPNQVYQDHNQSYLYFNYMYMHVDLVKRYLEYRNQLHLTGHTYVCSTMMGNTHTPGHPSAADEAWFALNPPCFL